MKSKSALTLFTLVATWIEPVQVGIVSAVESKNCKPNCELKTMFYVDWLIAGAGGLETAEEAAAAAIAAGYSSGSFDVRLDEGLKTWSAWTSGPDPQTDQGYEDRCLQRKKEPAGSDKANDPGEITIDEFDVDENAQGCTSCSTNSATQSVNDQFKGSPTGFNMDIGLGRDSDGVALGRLRFGFDLSAENEEDRFTLNPNADKGRFVVEDFVDSAGSQVIISPSTERISQIYNAQLAMSFVWTTHGEDNVTGVEIIIAPLDLAMNPDPNLAFKASKITMTKDEATGVLTIKKQVTSPTVPGGLLTTQMMIDPGTMDANQSYEWTLTRWDGVVVSGVSALVTDPVHGLVRTTRMTELKDGQKITRDYTHKRILNGEDAEIARLLVFARVERGGVESSKAYTYHEGLDKKDPRYHQISSVTYHDGSWVAYPYYDSEGEPIEELRPFGDLPATATEGLTNPNQCKRTTTSLEERTALQVINQKLDEGLSIPSGMNVPACEKRITEEYVQGVKVSTTIHETDIMPSASLGFPFGEGRPLNVDWIHITKNATRDKDG